MVHNPAGLYSENQGIFNSQPYTNYFLQQEAKRKAKEEALDNYFQKLPTTINEAGVRDQDRPVLDKKLADAQSYWIQNKDAIRKGLPERYNYEKMIRDVRGTVDESKERGKTALELGKLKFQKGNEYIFQDPNFIKQMSSHDLPIGAEGSAPLDLYTATLPVKPFDPNAYFKKYDDIKYGEGTPTITPHPQDKFLEVVTTPKVLGQEAKVAIAQRAASEYNNDPSFRNEISNNLAKNHELFGKLSKVYQDNFGKPIETYEELAAAYTLNGMPQGTATQKVRENYQAQQASKNAEWNRRNALSFRQSMQKIAANKAAGKPVEDTGYISDNVADEVGQTIEMANGKTRRVIDVTNVDPERLNIIIGQDLSKKQLGVEPTVMYDPATKKNKLVYYQDQETGDWIGKDGQKISREAAKDRYVNKYSPTAFKSKINTQAQEKKAGTQQNTKPATKKDPLGIL